MIAMIGRIFLGALACLMLAWGVAMPVVTLFGDEVGGEIVSVRRQLGDRGEAIPNRYVYAISYRFNVPGGASVVGYTQRLGDYFSPKSIGKMRAVRVRYMPAFPWLNTIDYGWGVTFEYLVVALVGALLLHLSTKKKAIKPRKAATKRASKHK